jgi:ABC-type multidrug transport system ATPase subunit
MTNNIFFKNFSIDPLIEGFTLEMHCETGSVYAFYGGEDMQGEYLLKSLSAIEAPTNGLVEINHKAPFPNPYIPELPSSFPWLTVEQNLKMINDDPKEIKRALTVVGLEDYGDYHPDNSSFGFRKRISLARALVANPRIITLADPFRYCSAETRRELIEVIKNSASEYDITIICWFRSASEAKELTDNIFPI